MGVKAGRLGLQGEEAMAMRADTQYSTPTPWPSPNDEKRTALFDTTVGNWKKNSG